MAVVTHGHAKREHHSPTYESWRDMLKRCRSPHRQYYGGRGIRVCSRWERFENFLADMGPRPAGTSLDRIDVNGHYFLSNCRWASAKTQARNQRGRTPVTFQGETLLLSEWAERTGVSTSTLWARLYSYGWTVEEALSIAVTTPWSRMKGRTAKSGLMLPEEGAGEDVEWELP